MSPYAPDIDLGKNIQTVRKSQGMTIKQLSEQIGISASMLSQIERGLANPSIATMKSIADALHEPLYNFFLPNSEENNEDLITRAGQRSKYAFSPIEGAQGRARRPDGYQCERLSTQKTPNLVMLRVTLPPHSISHSIPRQHEDTEIAFVENGAVKVQLGDKTVPLNCHDSITILPNIPHRWINESDEDIHLLLSMSVL